jgi:hypothetical protein
METQYNDFIISPPEAQGIKPYIFACSLGNENLFSFLSLAAQIIFKFLQNKLACLVKLPRSSS